MAHHSYLSPDGRWVLIVEMDSQGKILPCRVVPFQGREATSELLALPTANVSRERGRRMANGSTSSNASNADPGRVGRGGWLSAPGSHIWRQRFPDGEPEQLTFGPTSQEGIAMAPDGKSLITSVGSQDRTVWLHDKDGDHQISSEGNASSPSFSSDGRSLYFLMSNGQTHGEELWIKDLAGGKVEQRPARLLHAGLLRVARRERGRFTMNDQGGHYEPLGRPDQPPVIPRTHLLSGSR